eukprot:COSAG01_NODE_1699_length_9452_cov_47.169251_1_plen_45_part_00
MVRAAALMLALHEAMAPWPKAVASPAPSWAQRPCPHNLERAPLW